MNVTQSQWLESNKNLLWLWNETYPEIIAKGFQFPIDHDFLKYFYKSRVNFEFPTVDIDSEYNNNFMNTYDYALDYFLTYYGKPAVPGKTWLDHVVDNFPKALQKTFDQVSFGVGSALIILAIILFIKS